MFLFSELDMSIGKFPGDERRNSSDSYKGLASVFMFVMCLNLNCWIYVNSLTYAEKHILEDNLRINQESWMSDVKQV